ncbi:MAG: DbpA RNA binding domain-containing protein, partial [Methylococcales bacterium]|nr:DbpA RNA binding domain-containing protein [Methylococcales bacterium]
LDEADEMLNMGFKDELDKILEATPSSKQTLLFSATFPKEVEAIARNYMHEPIEISAGKKNVGADSVTHEFYLVSDRNRYSALKRIADVNPEIYSIVFCRTRRETKDVADKLIADGYSADALHGDLSQAQRDMVMQKFRSKHLQILVATDVAARGLDVDRISHVINYDIPNETEAYVHRIGRTGRAGRTGEAILFVTPREQHWIRRIEKATRQKIKMMELPSTDMINDKRVARFKQNITDALAREGLEFYQTLIEEFQQEHNIPATEIAAALARLVQGKEPLLLREIPAGKKDHKRREGKGRSESKGRSEARGRDDSRESLRSPKRKGRQRAPEAGMETYRIEVGHDHEVQPGNIVGAIANEAGLDSRNIGRIDIRDNYSFVDLPEGMPKDVFMDLKKTWVAGQKLNITRVKEEGDKQAPQRKSKSDKPKKPRTKSKRKPKAKRKKAK